MDFLWCYSERVKGGKHILEIIFPRQTQNPISVATWREDLRAFPANLLPRNTTITIIITIIITTAIVTVNRRFITVISPYALSRIVQYLRTLRLNTIQSYISLSLCTFVINSNYARKYRLRTPRTFDFPFPLSANYNRRVRMSLNVAGARFTSRCPPLVKPVSRFTIPPSEMRIIESMERAAQRGGSEVSRRLERKREEGELKGAESLVMAVSISRAGSAASIIVS